MHTLIIQSSLLLVNTCMSRVIRAASSTTDEVGVHLLHIHVCHKHFSGDSSKIRGGNGGQWLCVTKCSGCNTDCTSTVTM